MAGLNGNGLDAFDIGELRATDTSEIAINHPVTGAPTTWIWTLAGPGHPRSIEAANTAARETLRVQRLREQAIVNRRKWVEPERTPDEMRDENAKSFAVRVLGWTPARINGEDYPFSQENCLKLLKDPAYGRVYLQLLEYLSSDESFTQRSATTSPDSQSENSH
jgi:hypothetical protein